MNSLDCFKTDPTAEIEGVWEPVPNSGTGMEVLIARMWNQRMLDLYRTMNRARKEGQEPLDPDSLEVEAELFSKTVLLGWRRMFADGVETAYTPELGLQVLKDPRYHEFLEFVRGKANARNRYLNKEADDARKG